jgi:hypothetical protein
MKPPTRPKIVCIICPTRHAGAVTRIPRNIEVAGEIALWSPALLGSDAYSDGDPSGDGRLETRDIFRCKIAMADEVVVVDEGGQADTITQSDICFARAVGKRVRCVMADGSAHPVGPPGAPAAVSGR